MSGAKQPPPYQVQLLLGGALPYKWDLYDYAPNGTGWSRTHLGNGGGASWFSIPLAGNLAGHVLVWSVAVVMEDDKPLTIDVIASVKTATGSDSQTDQWTASKDNRRLLVSVGVKA